MTYLTIKDIGLLLLLGVLVFPVGINQSYAQTGGLDDRTFEVSPSSSSEFTETFDGIEYRRLLNLLNTFSLGLFDVYAVTVDVGAGSGGGTATFTNNGQSAESGLFIATLTYTRVPGFIGTETFTYTGTGNDVTTTGTLTFNVGSPPNAAPTTPNIIVSAVQDAAGSMDFSEIDDDSDGFEDFTSVTFGLTNSTASNPATNLSTQVVFNTDDSTLTDSNSRLTVSSETLRFTVNDDAALGEYNLAYTVTDSEGDTSTGNVIFTITAPIPTTLDDRTFDVPESSLPTFTETFNLTAYGELLNLRDVFGFQVNRIRELAVSIDETGSGGGTATFTNNGDSVGLGQFLATLKYTPDDRFSGTETFTYTGSHGGTTASGTFTFIVELIQNIAPTTPDIAATGEQGFTGIMDFSEIDDDSDMEFADFTSVTFDLTNSTNPESNLSTQVVFNTDDSTLTDSNSRLTVSSETLRFTVDDDATVGEYNLEYRVTDSEGDTSTGNVIFTIIEPIPNTAPTAPNFEVQIKPRNTATIPFGDIIRDTESDFDDLTVTFSFVVPDLAGHRVSIPSGATVVAGSDGGATFTVDAENVVISEDSDFSGNSPPVPRTIELTYTVFDGKATSTGTVDILVVLSIRPPLGERHLDDRTFTVIPSSIADYGFVFHGRTYINLINLVDTFGLVAADALDVILSIEPVGSQGGTITFVNNGEAELADLRGLLTYTRVPGFVGTETFTYTGTGNNVTASGTLTFVIPDIQDGLDDRTFSVPTTSLPDFETVFTLLPFLELVNYETVFNALDSGELLLLVIGIDSIGSEGGAATFISNERGTTFLATLTYTPAPGFTGTETFTYHGNADAKEVFATGVFTFIVEEASNTAPTADDINIQIVQNSEATILIGDAINDNESLFSDLVISFSFDDTDLSASQIGFTSGATQVRDSVGDPLNSFTVDDENIVITETSSRASSASVPRTVVLTYTVSDGFLESTGKVNISVVAQPNAAPTAPDILVSSLQGATDEISFSAINDDYDYFAELDIEFHLTNSTNPESNLSTQVVFNTDDSTLTDSNSRLTVSSEPLRFTVDDEATVGEYNLEYTVTDREDAETTGNVIFTIVEKPNSAPTADDINIQIVPNDSATISFDDAISDTQTDFSDLDIEFSFVETDLTVNQISVTSGADVVDGSEGGATFTVTAGDVVFTEQDGSGILDVPRTIELTYTVTDTGDLSDTGTVSIFVVESITSTFDGNLDDETFDVPALSLPTFTETFDGAAFADLINLDTTFGLSDEDITDITLDIEDGSNGGTVTFTHNNGNGDNFLATLTYTQDVGFVGTETFAYTGTINDVIASGTLTFNAASPLNSVPTAPDILVSAVQGSTDEISFSTIDDNEDMAFADFISVTFDLTNSTNPETNLSTQVVFNTDDATLTDSNSRLSVSSETLRFTVNAEATVGVYNLEYRVTDSQGDTSTGNVIFTITALLNSAPTADNINIQIVSNSEATIPFGDIISDTQTDFSDLTILFSFVETDLTAHQISVTSGATVVDGSEGMATFTVDDEDVVISETSDSDSSASVPRTIELTYTVSDNVFTSTGTVNISVVAAPIVPLDENLGLDDGSFTVPASLSPGFERIFTPEEYANLMNLVETFGLAGPQISDIIVGIEATGSHGGTATFITNETTLNFIATLTYTPAEGFAGTETFAYSGTTERGTATGIISFTVEGVTCETSLNAGVEFGELGVGVTSDTSSLSISNDGNVPVQSLIAGANWVSAADESISTMNVGQTRYSVTETDLYDARTPFTATPVDVGNDIAESGNLDIYLQLFVGLIDESFRGDTTQTMTITSNCSEDP